MPLSKDSITKALGDVRSKTPKRKFTQSIELSVKLREIDLKKPEGRINENLELPTAADKDSKVAVIAGGDLAVRARNAGADIVIGREDSSELRLFCRRGTTDATSRKDPRTDSRT